MEEPSPQKGSSLEPLGSPGPAAHECADTGHGAWSAADLRRRRGGRGLDVGLFELATPAGAWGAGGGGAELRRRELVSRFHEELGAPFVESVLQDCGGNISVAESTLQQVHSSPQIACARLPFQPRRLTPRAAGQFVEGREAAPRAAGVQPAAQRPAQALTGVPLRAKVSSDPSTLGGALRARALQSRPDRVG